MKRALERATILHSLAEIGYTIVLDQIAFRQDNGGYESTFHFEKRQGRTGF